MSLEGSLDLIARELLGTKRNVSKSPKLVRVYVTNHTYERTLDLVDIHKVDFMFQTTGSDADPGPQDPDAPFLIRGAVCIAGWMPRILSWAYALSLGGGSYVVLPITESEQVFIQNGTVVVGTSPVYRPPHGEMYLVEVMATLKVAGSTDTVIEVYRREFDDGTTDGTLMGTVTIGSGNFEISVLSALTGWTHRTVKMDQALMMKVTSAGTGAQDLTISVRYI